MDPISALQEPFVQRAFIAITMASLVAGLVSLMIRYSQLQFLAVESFHALVAAAAVGYFVELFYPVSPELVAYLVMVGLLGFLNVLEGRVERLTAIAALSLSSATIISLFSFGLAQKSPFGSTIIYNILFGTPFLILQREIPYVVIAGSVMILVLAALWKRILMLSFDPDYFAFMKGNNSFLLHRLFIYAMVAAAAVYLTKITGAVAAHVLLIAPSLAPFRYVSPVTVLLYALAVCYSAAFASIALNLPYGAALGFFALLGYLLPALLRKG
ncbi:MAG: metal ABC transporter permease [Acidilobaceae archaeon]|nr:metal ABC transporter permease [Acidilobaceae archaeon]MDW7974770.1 metal ABC transporter permease [Sulfolobales archaeon]